MRVPALLIVLLFAVTAHADDTYIVAGPSVARDTVDAVPGELDTLFEALKASTSPARAKGIADRIWLVWFRAPDLRAASRMNRNLKYRDYGEYWDSMDQIEHVIRRHPDYAEGYNQRSFLHYLQGDYEASLSDCRRALELEPRHFGCMGGMARVLQKLGRDADARRMIERALAIHPFIAERWLFPDLAGPRLKL